MRKAGVTICAVLTASGIVGSGAAAEAATSGSLTVVTSFSSQRTVGTTVTAASTVRVAGTATNVNVRLEVLSPAGSVVSRKDMLGQRLNRTLKSYSQSFRPGAQGTYRARVRVYTAGWKRLVYRIDNTGAVVIRPVAGKVFPTGRQTRVMALGDSITYGLNGDGKTGGTGGYRARLWPRLRSHGWSFVPVGPQHDEAGDHAGFPGWRIRDLVNGVPEKSPSVESMLQTYQPDVVLLHIGTNDFGFDDDEAGAPTRAANLINEITTLRPGAQVFVAWIIDTWAPVPEQPGVGRYNDAVARFVAQQAAAGKHVHSVDMRPAVTRASDLGDGIHPTDVTYGRMAGIWDSALAQADATG